MSERENKCCALAIKATAIILPSTVTNWLGFNPEPCFATRASNDCTRPSFINVTKVELLAIIEVYCAGLDVSAATIISLWSLVRLVSTITPSPAQVLAAAVTAWIAGKSFERMLTLPEEIPHPAIAVVPRNMNAPATVILFRNICFSQLY